MNTRWVMLVLVGTWLILAAGAMEGVAPLPRTLTEKEKAKLKERDRLTLEGNKQWNAGKLPEALALLRAALEVEREVQGDAGQAATRLETLARLCVQREDWAAAKKARAEALAIQVRVYGKKSWRVIDARRAAELGELVAKMTPEQRKVWAKADQLNRQVVSLYGQKQYEKAMPVAREALRLRAEVLGEKHIDTMGCVYHLGLLHLERGELLEAAERQLQAWGVFKEVLGVGHPVAGNLSNAMVRCATGLNHLGRQASDKGEYKQARSRFEAELKLRMEVSGEHHANYATCLNNIAMLDKAMGDYTNAHELYKKAVNLRQQILGERHPDYATSLANLAVLYRGMGEYEKARDLQEKALKLRKEILGERHPDYANSLSNLAVLHQSRGEYPKARELFTQALKLRKEVLGNRHREYAISLQNLATFYLATGEYVASQELHEQALKLTKDVVGERHPDYATCIHNLASLHQARGEYPKARELFAQTLMLRKKVLGERHPAYAATLSNFALLHTEMGEHRKAQELYQEALSVIKGACGERHPDYATTLSSLAAEYRDMAEHVKAEQLFDQALKLQKVGLGERHPAYAVSLSNLALLHLARGEYPKAQELFAHALKLRKDALGESHPAFATGLINCAMLYHAMAEFPKAINLMEQALVITKATMGERHPTYVTIMNDTGLLYRDIGKIARARDMYEIAEKLAKEVLGDRHPKYVTCLNNLALIHQDFGEYSKAIALHSQALKLRQEIFGACHPDCATSLANLALVHRDIGEYLKSREFHEQALKLRKALLGEHHPDYAASLSNLASLHLDMGDDTKARQLTEQALRLRKKALGERHPEYAMNLHNLASIRCDMGDHARSRELYEQALKLQLEVLGERHPTYATSLNNIATLCLAMREPSKAQQLYEQALRLQKDVLGERHPNYATSLHNLARLHAAVGEYAKARELVVQALKVQKDVLGERHPAIATSLSNLSMLNYLAGNRDDAVLPLEQSLAIRRQYLANTLPSLGSRQRLQHVSKFRKTLDFYLTLSPLPTTREYEEVFTWKGFLTSQTSETRQLYSDPILRPTCVQLQEVRAALATTSANTPPPTGMAEWRRRFDALEARKDNLEQELARKSLVFRTLLDKRKPDPVRIAKALPDDSALIEYAEYFHSIPPGKKGLRATSERRLLAFVLRRGEPVACVPLGVASPVERHVAAWREAVTGSASPEQSARELRKLIWDPVSKHIGNAKTVLIAPDGPLCNLPFAALPGSKPGTFLLEELTIGYLTSGLQLLESEAPQRADGLLLLGGLDFGPGTPTASQERRFRPWNALPGAALESRHIEATFRQVHPKDTSRKLGGKTDRSALLKEIDPHAKGRRFRHIHLATHAFFEPPAPLTPLPALGAWTVGVGFGPKGAGPLMSLSALTAAEEPGAVNARRSTLDLPGITYRTFDRNPMLLAGLVLGGANQSEEKGLMSAEEISALDLGGCDLVVLSACDTGRGKLAGMQGVQSLQRAFQEAGTRAQLASLWSVKDPATSVLMELFYQNLWVKKQPPLQAIREAQLTVLREPKRVQQRREELRRELVKQGVTKAVLASRGIEDDAVDGPVGPGRAERSPVSWWAPWVLSGAPTKAR